MVRLREAIAAQDATGCWGASGYLFFAEEHGYNHVEVLNWTSSAGDWQFLASKDGVRWRILEQTNNYPRAGFSHELSEGVFEGTFEEVAGRLCEL